MENPAAPALATWAARLPLAVAFSGGADSTVLLHAAAQRWPGQVLALHVNHGLQQAAGDFEAHCIAVCAALGTPLHIGTVDARHVAGESPEDAARRARYLSLAGMAKAHDIGDVLLAQHADDQVETLLIALGRGAGLDGLAGMPPEVMRHGVRFHRPLLDVPGPDHSLTPDSFANHFKITPGKLERSRLQVAYSKACIAINAILIKHGVSELPVVQQTAVRSLDNVMVAVMGVSVKYRKDLKQIFCEPAGRDRLRHEFARYFELSPDRVALVADIADAERAADVAERALFALDGVMRSSLVEAAA